MTLTIKPTIRFHSVSAELEVEVFETTWNHEFPKTTEKTSGIFVALSFFLWFKAVWGEFGESETPNINTQISGILVVFSCFSDSVAGLESGLLTAGKPQGD